MKKLIPVLVLTLIVSLLAGCAGTTVVVCTCPTESGVTAPVAAEAPAEPAPTAAPAETAVKTGLYIGASIADSVSAAAEEAGEAKFDVTVAAVNVDDNGVITSCVIDSIPASVKFGADGVITSDVTAAIATKNELGENYGMKAYGGAKYEWNEQVAALASYAVGKTVEELKTGAVNESGKAADADLASTATIYLGGFVSAIEQAVNNAAHLGAQLGDELRLASVSSLSDSKSADAENAGAAQLNADVTALTLSGKIITSCTIDSVQAKVNFDANGTVTTDVSAMPMTKNQLGENYGMKLYAGSAFEWNEQAAAFAAYVTGMTAEDVNGMAVNERTAPLDADLAATVTIAVGGFQALIAKAAA